MKTTPFVTLGLISSSELLIIGRLWDQFPPITRWDCCQRCLLVTIIFRSFPRSRVRIPRITRWDWCRFARVWSIPNSCLFVFPASIKKTRWEWCQRHPWSNIIIRNSHGWIQIAPVYKMGVISKTGFNFTNVLSATDKSFWFPIYGVW